MMAYSSNLYNYIKENEISYRNISKNHIKNRNEKEYYIRNKINVKILPKKKKEKDKALLL